MRSLTLTANKKKQILATMFAAYGQAGDEKRLAAYGMALADVPEELRERLRELARYYESSEWKRDFEDDEAGRLPQNLKRGVLSEDGIYDVLTWFGE